MHRSVSRTLPALALLVAGALLGACGGSADSPSPPAPAGPPARIVSLAPSHTELLFALGAGERVVGVTRFCDRPAEAKSRPAVGDALGVSLEKVASLRPDLVVVNADATAAAVAPLKVRVLRVSTDTLPDLLAAVDTLGREVGREEAARALRARMDGMLAAARAKGRGRGKALVVVQREPFMVAGGGSYVHGLLEALGYGNAAGDLPAPWPVISAEALVVRAPEVVVDASLGPAGTPVEAVAWWSRYPLLPAVKAGRVRPLPDDAALRPGPGIDRALEALESALEGR